MSTYPVSNTKAGNYIPLIPDFFTNEEGYKFDVNAKDKEPIDVFCKGVETRENERIVKADLEMALENARDKFGRPIRLTQWDIQVMEAVYMLMHYHGKTRFTLNELFRAVYHTDEQHINSERLEALKKEMMFLMSTYVEINYEMEFRKRMLAEKLKESEKNGGKQKITFTDADESEIMRRHFRGTLIAGIETTTELLRNKKTATQYEISVPPIFMKYAEDTKKIIAIDESFFKLPESVKPVQLNLEIVHYIAKKIAQMMYKRDFSRRIALNYKNNKTGLIHGLMPYIGLYREDFTDRQWAKKKEGVVKTCRKILDYYKEQDFIKDYSEYSEGSSHSLKGFSVVHLMDRAALVGFSGPVQNGDE